MFKTRLISGVLLLLATFLVINGSGIILWTALICISTIGMQELYRAMKIEKNGSLFLTLAGFGAVLLYYCALLFSFTDYGLMGLMAGLLIFMGIYVFTYPKYRAEQVMAAYFSLLYVAVMLSFIYLTRILSNGMYCVWLIFICSWGCDTCAYCVGVLIGKHKMAPVLSPKKSIEGAIGGITGAALLGMIYGAIIGAPLQIYAFICAVGALISMIGDLAASAIKRNQEIKDYGTLIPGHGGILDRFDSVIFTAPVIYYLSVLLL